jgi:hypothetical protein
MAWGSVELVQVTEIKDPHDFNTLSTCPSWQQGRFVTKDWLFVTSASLRTACLVSAFGGGCHCNHLSGGISLTPTSGFTQSIASAHRVRGRADSSPSDPTRSASESQICSSLPRPYRKSPGLFLLTRAMIPLITFMQVNTFLLITFSRGGYPNETRAVLGGHRELNVVLVLFISEARIRGGLR